MIPIRILNGVCFLKFHGIFPVVNYINLGFVSKKVVCDIGVRVNMGFMVSRHAKKFIAPISIE